MAIQQFTAGQTLTAAAMNTLQASDFNYTRKIVTTATYTAVLEDRGQLLEFQNAGGTTVTIPPNSSVAFSLGDVLEIISSSSATVQIVGDTGVTIEATGGITSLTSAWQKAQLVKRETNNWVLTGITSVAILDSTITNADVANNAAIALSKIASGTAAQVVIANSSGTPTYTTISGDVTINSSGVVQIEPGKIVDADINASAAIDKTKISGTAITAGDTGTVTSTMIADGTIVNGDINASAAIAASKISGTAITAADTGTVTSTMIADGTIVNADINASAAIALGKLADATIDIKTGNYTLQLTDKNKFIKMNITSTANTVTVPLDSTVTFPEGAQIHIIQYGTGKTQIVGASGSVILYSTPGAYLRAQYSSATLLKCAAANTWMLMGDLSAS
jgi:sporulation protein YlmC with PRC-barrel domain